jgi:CDP-paratose 2-epimerase
MKKNPAMEREIHPVVFREPARNGSRPVLITGGAGFIGCNLAHRLLSMGNAVIVLDDLSRHGVERNLKWLRKTHGEHVRAEIADVRDGGAVRDAVSHARQVFHFAAQVAVTTSLDDPRLDFAVNAGGTLNVLEAIRAQADPPPLVFTSTNKVYGGLADIALERCQGRYEPRDPEIREHGVSEDRRLDFHSPYGCSKGTADQYVLDYARSYGLKAIVFRMSCIYGPHQFGTEDQGWVAHFLIRAIEGSPIVLYGDGMQVRDILFVDDLVDAFLLAQRSMDRHGGTAFNIGGGAANTTSLLELLDLIERIHGDSPDVAMQEWRTGDQRYYVSDTRRFQQSTGWQPRVGVEEGVTRLHDWLVDARSHARARARAEPARRVAAVSALTALSEEAQAEGNA